VISSGRKPIGSILKVRDAIAHPIGGDMDPPNDAPAYIQKLITDTNNKLIKKYTTL